MSTNAEPSILISSEFTSFIEGEGMAPNHVALLKRCIKNNSYTQRVAASRGPIFEHAIDKLREAAITPAFECTEDTKKQIGIFRFVVEDHGDLKLTGASTTRVSSQHA